MTEPQDAPQDAFVPFYQPADQVELALIKSLLTSEGIGYFVQNEHYASLYPMSITGPFRLMVMVRASQCERAKTLLEQTRADPTDANQDVHQDTHQEENE